MSSSEEIERLIRKYQKAANDATTAAARADYGDNSWGHKGLEQRAKAARGVVAGLKLALDVVRKNELQEENDNDNDQT